MERHERTGRRVHLVPRLLILACRGRPVMELCFAKTLYACPSCQSSAIRRSTRRGFVERVLLRAALVWPYRCDDCDVRFWGFHRALPASVTGDSRDLRAA